MVDLGGIDGKIRRDWGGRSGYNGFEEETMARATSEDKIKKLEELIAKKRAELTREKGRRSEKERKARNRDLIQLGILAEMAGLRGSDRGFVLGCLLKAKDIDPGNPRYQELKILGDKLLKEREEARKREEKEVANG